MQIILIGIYIILGYWAVGKTIWANKIIIGTDIWGERVMLGVVFGWILIPIALLKCIFLVGSDVYDITE